VIDLLGVSVILRFGECPKAKIHGREKKEDIPAILDHRAGIELQGRSMSALHSNECVTKHLLMP